MRFWVHAALASTALLGISTTVQAQREPVVLEPSSGWSVYPVVESCRLARTFGDGENLHALFFEQYFPSESAGLMVAGPSFDSFRSRARTHFSINEEQEPLRTEPFTGDVDNVGTAVIYSRVNLERGTASFDESTTSLPQLDTEFAEGADYIALKQRSREVRFATGPLGEAFAALNGCTQGLIGEWGLDIEKHMTATRLPEWTNESAVVRRIASRYPSTSLRRGQQAILRLRVNIDEEGKVTECVIEEATDTPLESPACQEMQDAEFTPALDANGEPFPSYYATSIIYQIG